MKFELILCLKTNKTKFSFSTVNHISRTNAVKTKMSFLNDIHNLKCNLKRITSKCKITLVYKEQFKNLTDEI